MGSRSFLLLVFTFVCTGIVNSKRLEGVIDTKSNWKFLTRFCFLNQLGGLTYEIEYPKTYGTQRLLFYYDTPGQWSYVYKRDKTCEEKTDVATNVGNYFSLDSTYCSIFNKDGTEWYRCANNLDFHSSRERWWYLVVERCADAEDPSKEGLYMEYTLHLTNGDDLLHQEFSADQFYILPINIIFFILYVIILILSIIVALLLKKKTLYHTTYAMYMGAITLWTLSLLCLVIAWGSYGNTGWEMNQMEVFGRFLQAASNIIFMLMLILMAKGYTIVRGRLTNKATIKITVFIMLYTVFTIILFIWEAHIFDPGLVLFYYENPAGYGMIAVQLIGWLWMTKAAVFTLKHHSNTTSRFYIPFYIIFTVWFWLAPIVIMFAICVMPKWMREKTVHGVLQFVAFAGHIIFLVLTRPSKANSNFPYNVKTSQIGIVGGEDSSEDADSTPRNLYSISYHTGYNGTGPNLDIFITSKGSSNSSSNNNYSNIQAGYQNGGMYPSTDGFLASSSDSPPPSYPQAVAGSFENPDSGRDDNNESSLMASNYYNQNGGGDSSFSGSSGGGGSGGGSGGGVGSGGGGGEFQPSLRQNNRLPPIGQLPPLGSDLSTTRETTLPPIRGSGLPALELEPSAPSDQSGDRELPPNYSKLFQVK